MGGGKPKRKSEGDLPPAKKQARRVQREEDEVESSQAEEESDHDLFIHETSTKAKPAKKPAKKSRKSDPVPRLEREDDSEEDETGGLLESREFLQFVAKKERDKSQVVKATAEFKAQFSNDVEDDEKKLKKHIESLGKESAKRDADFLGTYQEAFTFSRPKALPAKASTCGKNTPATMAFASLQERSHQIISNASAIVRKFEQVNEMTTSIELSEIIDVKSWDDSIKQTQDVINLGHRAGLMRAEKMLAGDRSRIEFDDDRDSQTAEMFYPAEKYPEISTSWCDIAKKAEKHSRHILKAFPRTVHTTRVSD